MVDKIGNNPFIKLKLGVEVIHPRQITGMLVKTQ